MTDHEHTSYVSHSNHNRNDDSYMLFSTLHHVYRKVENNTIHEQIIGLEFLAVH